MTIPFIDFFKNVKARLFPLVREAKPASPSRRIIPEKSGGQRLSKTVLPSTARARVPVDPFHAAANRTAAAPVPRSVSFDSSRKPSGGHERHKPVADAPEPPVERSISLQISDILDQLPQEQIKSPENFNPAREIVLKATEVEKGMAAGKPSVALATIYEQAPEIFSGSVSPGDSTLVLLPFGKVLEQFKSLKVRTDQESEQAVPQLETPFLAVTLEDTERFGTTIKQLEASASPPVKIEPATAKAISDAEPEAAVREVARPAPPQPHGSTSSPRPTIPMRDLDVLEPTSVAAGGSPATPDKQPDAAAPVAPKKIPFHLPPNGTGEPASERVPASSGPSVPNLPVPPAPARNPFKFTAPAEDIRPKFTLVPGVEPKEKAPPLARKSLGTDGEKKVALSLQSLLQEVPAFQLNGSPMAVGDDVKVEFPLSLIEPQLASGRVVVPARVFARAIPEMHRGLFVVDPNETPISLPLQEIVKHLPPAALKTRGDQEEIAAKESFTTPFSIQADEDAKRFDAMAAAAAVAVETATAEPQAGKQTQEKSVQPPACDSPHPVDQKTGEENSQGPTESEETSIDAKTAVTRASALPGVKACAITFADGLSLAGNIPAEFPAEGICAMAPSILQKIDSHLLDTKLGALQALTLYCTESPLTFFMHGNICLTALHAGEADLVADTRDQLAAIVHDLSRTYAEPELAHVDH